MSAHPPNDDLVLRSDADGIATLTLNRPNNFNTLSTPLMQALQRARGPLRNWFLEKTPRGLRSPHAAHTASRLIVYAYPAGLRIRSESCVLRSEPCGVRVFGKL